MVEFLVHLGRIRGVIENIRLDHVGIAGILVLEQNDFTGNARRIKKLESVKSEINPLGL